MFTSEITPAVLGNSVISVPPLARNVDGSLNRDANQKIIKYLETGGVSTLLYGGNALMHHVALSEYAELLTQLTELVAEETCVIPSVGPSYGLMIDQARVLRDYDFPTAMILPTRDVFTPAGIGQGVRKFVEHYGKPAILYIKNEGYIDVETVSGLMKDGLLSAIKYAIVRENTIDDVYLRELTESVGPSRIVSGIGEQPAIVHMRNFELTSFTSGCVCIAPKLSMAMLRAIHAEDDEAAEQFRNLFSPLEDLRNSINPIRVLHTAVALTGIAETGPILPLMSNLDPTQHSVILEAATNLLTVNRMA